MTERDLLEIIAQQVGCLTVDMSSVKTEIGSLKSEMNNFNKKLDTLTTDVDELKRGQLSLVKGQQKLEQETRKTNNIIESDIKPKIQVLFDYYQQNTNRIKRIERRN